MSRPVFGTPPRHLFQNPIASLVRHHPLHVAWYKTWHPVLDEALKVLPEVDTCPHELFRLLAQNPGPSQKRVALVTDDGEPIAVIGLRRMGRCSWTHLTQWITPGVMFPSKPGYALPAIEALNTEVWVAWWRMGNSEPRSRLIRSIVSTPTHRMHCANDFEQYWRENGFFKNIRNMRNRCKGFKLVINKPGSAEWVIKNWSEKWRCSSNLSDRVLVANYLERQGRHYTLMLVDNDIPIGGSTNFVHNNDLVAGVIYREMEYEKYGVGSHLIDMVFSFATGNGFEMIDIGGGHKYKQKWAPQDGRHFYFNVCPGFLFNIKQVVNWVRTIRIKPSDEIESLCECDLT